MSRAIMMLRLGISGISCFLLLGCFAAEDLFECPREVRKSANDVADYFEFFEPINAQHVDLRGFRDRSYGGRGHTYNEMKKLTRGFKRKVFGDNLNNGDIIYESAAGEGFNTLMTVELLKERGLDNITAYGNDYLQDSTAAANAVFKRVFPNWKGKFCQGDSTDLSFVPSNTFDLAYTGVIDVLIDPLRLYDKEGATYSQMVHQSRRRCFSRNPEDQRLAGVEQQMQEEWHAKWVTELVRIVKPGKLVIIEDDAYPLCLMDPELMSEWGGVSVEWWKDAVDEYKWDVEPESLQFIHKTWYDNRYIVLMRKQSEPESAATTIASGSVRVA